MIIPRYIFLFFWLCASTFLIAQNPQLSLRHYTTDQGLPSPEVYEVLQDRRGYLWFGTDNGLSRFNGYQFRNYSAVDGLTDLVVFYIQEDHRGRIWIGTMSGQILYYEPTQDKIYPFWGNREIKKLQKKFPSIGANFYADAQDTVHVALSGYGILKFLPDSSLQVIRPSYQSTIVYQLPETVLTSGATYPVDSPEGQYYQKRWSPVDSTPVTFYHQNQVQHQVLLFNRKKPNLTPEAYFLNKNEVLIISGSYLHYYQNTKWTWTIPFPDGVVEFFPKSAERIVFGMSHISGCRKYANLEALQQNRYETILPNYTVPGILQDREGGYWFTTVQNGVFYCPKPDWQLYNEQSGLANGYITSVTLKNENEWFLSLNTGQVYYQNAALQQLQDLKSPANFCDDILYDANNQRLWAGLAPNLSFYDKSTGWEQATGTHPITKKQHAYTIYRFWQDEADQALWGAGYGGFVKIGADKTSADFYSPHINIPHARTLAVFKNKDGKVWIGRLDGLHEFRENEKKLYLPEVAHPAFRIRIEALAALPDTTLVIGTKGAGILLYKNKAIQQLTVKEGLTTNIIETLHVDANGTIWAGTLNGLNKITRNGAGFTIEHFTTAHGLPSNEINKIATRNGKIWVATMRGLVVFQDDNHQNTISPTPIIESFQVNDKNRLYPIHWGLRHFENNLTLQFTSLQFRNAGKIPYRYRLQTQTDWIYTREHRLNFAALQPANYAFEIQAQNEDGVWSVSTKLPFQIRPAWWQTGWFFGTLGLVCMLAGYFYYKSRIRAIQNKASIAAQITDLERKALAAQMNPHFIFNCLNSIQLLIHEKEENRALQYLARFAKLIRALLEFSRKGKVTILEEAQALENYLELEKLRFKEKLQCDIQVSPHIDQFETEIPPLLVQPFVENAIKHGLSDIESDGMVKITFALENDTLLVVIQDNGKGFDAANQAESRHRSMGIELTRRRLALANGRTEATDLIIQSNENQLGTSVQMRIKK